MADPVRCEVRDAVATVTLERPDALNALDRATKTALREVLTDVAAAEAVRAVVLTGTGRAFCVGQDLAEHAADLAGTGTGSAAGERTHGDPRTVWSTVAEHYTPIALALATMPKPVVAALNGVAAGAGAAFAFACDVRILADTAGFNLAFAGIGLSADSGCSWTLPRLVGLAKAKELLLFPRTVPAAEALELGLATQVVDAADVLPTAIELATRLATGPTVAYGAIRRALAFGAGAPLEQALAREGELMLLTGSTEDHRQAVEAFLRKEKPTFRGR